MITTKPRVHTVADQVGNLDLTGEATITISNERGQECVIAEGVPWRYAHDIGTALEGVLGLAITCQTKRITKTPQPTPQHDG